MWIYQQNMSNNKIRNIANAVNVVGHIYDLYDGLHFISKQNK